MKIKFKETKMPNITNITFDFTQSKLFAKKIDPKKTFTDRISSPNKIIPSSSFIKSEQNNVEGLKTCLLLKYNCFIPKNPNMKSVILSNQRQSKPLKSLQSAKQIQKKFPVRKVLCKASTVGTLFRKDKVFEFDNPQTAEFALFKNKQISSLMTRSQSLFYTRSKNLQKNQGENSSRKNKTSFHRYDTKNDLINSTTSLKTKQQKSDMFRSHRISNPCI